MNLYYLCYCCLYLSMGLFMKVKMKSLTEYNIRNLENWTWKIATDDKW